MEALADASVKSTGVKTEQQPYTAAGHLNAFLRSHGDLDVSSGTMHPTGHACVTAELMGRFGTYLFMNAKKSNATHSYMSQVVLCAQMARVGLVVAGLLDSDHGGIPPSPATIPSKDRPLFRALTPELFMSNLNIYDRAMSDV
ncbi:hypothetical protein FI667_g8628, partial [Globisporangium splendens]